MGYTVVGYGVYSGWLWGYTVVDYGVYSGWLWGIQWFFMGCTVVYGVYIGLWGIQWLVMGVYSGWLWGIQWLVMGVYSGWDSFLLKYGEVFLDEVSSV